MTFPVRNFIVWHVAVPYLVQALGPLHGNLVSIGRWDQTERCVLRQGAMPLSVEVHFPAQLAVPPGVLAGHVVHGLGGASIHGGRLGPEFQKRHEALPLARIGGGDEERLAARGGERVAEGRENEQEEEEDQAEERRGDEVQEPPLPRASLRCGQIQVTHFSILGSDQMGICGSEFFYVGL